MSGLSTRFDRTGGIGLLVGFGAAMTAAFWAYDGWGNIGPVAEEVKDPQRNIPLSLFVGMFILITLYIGATVAYLPRGRDRPRTEMTFTSVSVPMDNSLVVRL